MKTLKITFVLLLYYGLSYAQNDGYEMMYYSKIHFNTINTVGSRHLFYQHCFTDIDSLISNGIITHMNASIGNIQHCKYSIEVQDTIIKSVTIVTNSKKDSQYLKRLTMSLSSEYVESQANKKTYYYSGFFKINNYFCNLIYISDNKNKNAYLKIQKQVKFN